MGRMWDSSTVVEGGILCREAKGLGGSFIERSLSS